MAETSYQQLYYPTDDIVSRFKPSLSAYFDVFIKGGFGGVSNADINFLANEAVLPGTSYQTTEVFGDRQGVTETFANKRIYPPVDVTFYVDYDYKVLRYFESWMAAISPNSGATGASYNKFKYPETYKSEVQITKFERNFRKPNQRLVEGGVYAPPANRCYYTLRNAYPVNISSIPLSYDQSSLLRTTVTFNYDVYAFTLSNGTEINQPLESTGSAVSGPGGDTPTQQANILGNTQEQLNALQAQSFAKTISNLSPSKQNQLNSDYIKTLNK
jgi:hypothetical protein